MHLWRRRSRKRLVTVETSGGGGRFIGSVTAEAPRTLSIWAAELVGRYKRERKAIRSKAPYGEHVNLTAIGNDYGYDMVFERQLEAFAKPEDLLIAISTSSQKYSRGRGARSQSRNESGFSLTGSTGGKLASISDVLLNVPSTDTPRIQETHLLIEHIFCDCIEQSVM